MNELTEFNTGGSHQSNPLGGVPLGVNPQTGAPITVEEGETRTKIAGADFIFSNNYKITDKIIKDFNLPKELKDLPMSDASKKISDIFKDRQDGISSNTLNQFLGRLADAQEQIKAEKIQKLQEALNTNAQYMDEGLTNQAPQGVEEFIGQQQMAGGGFFSALLGNQTQAQKDINIANRDARYAEATARNENSSDLNIAGNVATNIASSAPAVMGLFNQAQGNTSPNVTKSALSGAMTGLSAGAAFGPIGMGVGAVGGLIAGHIGGNKAKKNLINQANDAAMNYNAQFQEQYADGGFPGLGGSMLKNNVYGGFKPQVKQNNNPLLQQQYELGQNIMTPDYLNKVAPHYANQNPIINAQNYLLGQNYNLNGGADGKWGTSSQNSLDAWRKANNISTTGGLTPADYEAMGYTNMGYTPYEEVLPTLTIDSNPVQNTTTSAIPDTLPDNTQEDPKDPKNKDKFNYHQLMRYMTPLGNVLQLDGLSKPMMGNLNQDLTKARRDYIDENTIARNIRNQGNTLNRSIQGSGMTEGARRASMLASNLNTQEALGNAFIQAQQSNRNIDIQADAIDAQTRQNNQRNRMLADENYQRDLGAYNTEKSKLTSQMYTDIGNIGLEGLRTDRVGKVFGYSVDGDYIVDDKTGERWNSEQINTKIKEQQQLARTASSEFEKKRAEDELSRLKSIQEQQVRGALKNPRVAQAVSKQTKKNK